MTNNIRKRQTFDKICQKYVRMSKSWPDDDKICQKRVEMSKFWQNDKISQKQDKMSKLC